MRATAQQSKRAPDGAPVHYECHRPEQTTLYRLMQQHAASFIAHTEASTGAELPRFVKDEIDAFLECGILAHGFVRLRCGERGHDRLLAFSCKRRGFCPSCAARRTRGRTPHRRAAPGPVAPGRGRHGGHHAGARAGDGGDAAGGVGGAGVAGATEGLEARAAPAARQASAAATAGSRPRSSRPRRASRWTAPRRRAAGRRGPPTRSRCTPSVQRGWPPGAGRPR